MKKNISLKDIAQEANVSTAAVSYVLNKQEHRVRPEIAKKIKTIAEHLNYRPNQIAKSLKTNKTHTIGLIVANINYRFTTGITTAIEAEAKKHNYTVLFGSSDENLEKFEELIHVLINRQVDGLILVPVENSDSQIASLKERGIPFVLIDRYFPAINTNYIAVDNYTASYKSVAYLINCGHTDIGFINLKTSEFHIQKRNRGYFNALKDNNINIDKRYHKEIKKESFDEDIIESIQDLIHISQKKLALFFATDTLAIHGLKYLNKLKLKVPKNISVVSFDEAEAFELYPCSITHSTQPLKQMGTIAVNTLFEVMKDISITRQILLQSSFFKGKSAGEK